MLLNILTLLGAIGLFLYGLRMLSNSVNKLCGESLRRFTLRMNGNRLQSIVAGFSVTAVLNSSRYATLMAVSCVNAGLMSLRQSIGYIMGANIGTTITAAVIAVIAAFVPSTSSLCYPIVALGFILLSFKKDRARKTGSLVLGIALLLLGIITFKNTVEVMCSSPAVSEFFLKWTSMGFGSVLIFLVLGILITALLQSSISCIIITFTMCLMGWTGFACAAAMVLGANIATSFSAQYAASDASVQARRAALTHLIFNICGAIIALPIISLVNFGEADSPAVLVLYTALFHFTFNFATTCVLAWFAGIIESLVTKWVKDAAVESDNRLKFIDKGIEGSPDIAIVQAFKEVVNFSEICREGFSYVPQILREKDPDKFEELRTKLVEYEEITDKMESSVASFLKKISMGEISIENADYVKLLYRVISELESLGDSGENISRTLDRVRIHKLSFDESELESLDALIALVGKAMDVMTENLKAACNETLTSIDNAYAIEDEINAMRNRLREEGIGKIEQQTDNYHSISYFLDLLSELEAMGDFMINVSQTLIGDIKH